MAYKKTYMLEGRIFLQLRPHQLNDAGKAWPRLLHMIIINTCKKLR